MLNRPAIPRRLEKALYQEVNSTCPVCAEANINSLTVHHIIPFERVRQHDPANMIVLCANCHSCADSGEVSYDQLFEIKRRLARAILDGKKPSVGGRTVRRTTRVSGAIAAGHDVNIGGDVIIKDRRAGDSRARTTIAGTVAEDKWKVGYLKYLGHRFNQFKEWEMKTRRRPMNHALIWVQYRRALRFNVQQTPLELFSRAVAFLTSKIDNTLLGRIRKGKGDKNHRGFSEFVSLGDDRIDLPPVN